MIEEKDGNPSHCFRQVEAKNLQHHPHVHYIVPAGGLAADGCRWIDSSRRFFLPVKALSKIFRDKFSDELRELFQQDRLQFHNSLQQLASSGGFNHFLWQLGRKDWVVYAKPPFGGAEHGSTTALRELRYALIPIRQPAYALDSS
jgi:hypothetical protein